jgi:tyrosine-protein phosphatase SIW14
MPMFRWTTSWRYWLSTMLLVGVVASIAWYAWNQEHHYRNVRVVKPGVLYRSGQLTKKGLERVLYENNIATVISLRGNTQGQPSTHAWEEAVCFKNFVHYVSIPLGSTEQRTHPSPGESFQLIDGAAKQFLDIMTDPVTYPRPVLVHCLAGVHRTGVMAALFRIEKEGWTRERAIAEMRALGYDDFTSYDPLRDYLLHWKVKR